MSNYFKEFFQFCNRYVSLVLIQGTGGSREELGKDYGAFRYISGYLNPLCLRIFRPEDSIIYNLKTYENTIVEPEVLYPIIPLVLCNYGEYIGFLYS